MGEGRDLKWLVSLPEDGASCDSCWCAISSCIDLFKCSICCRVASYSALTSWSLFRSAATIESTVACSCSSRSCKTPRSCCTRSLRFRAAPSCSCTHGPAHASLSVFAPCTNGAAARSKAWQAPASVGPARGRCGATAKSGRGRGARWRAQQVTLCFGAWCESTRARRSWQGIRTTWRRALPRPERPQSPALPVQYSTSMIAQIVPYW